MTTNNSVNTYIVPTTAHEVTMPSQPAFFAALTADDGNETGDGTSYQFVCDGVIFDQNSDYNNGTGVFTAPVTGRYFLRIQTEVADLAVAHTSGFLFMDTSNRDYLCASLNWGAIKGGDNKAGLEMTTLADMDAADTVAFSITISNGAKAVDIEGEAVAGTIRTSLSGYLVV